MSFPGEGKRLIKKLLATKPQDRPTADAAMKDAYFNDYRKSDKADKRKGDKDVLSGLSGNGNADRFNREVTNVVEHYDDIE